MITPESTDTALDASQPTRGWVWHSTDDSIAAGQISVLSVVETFCALGLYGWLAFHFEHQWWLLISAVAAPIILLSSPESKALGVKWLRSYWKNWNGNARNWHNFSWGEQISLITISLFIMGTSIAIFTLRITTHNELMAFWYSLSFGIFAFTSILISSFAITSSTRFILSIKFISTTIALTLASIIIIIIISDKNTAISIATGGIIGATLIPITNLFSISHVTSKKNG